jgi:hypothetical protein
MAADSLLKATARLDRAIFDPASGGLAPNPNWTETIQDLSFTSAVITVEQPPGTLVLTVTCSISPASSNGSVPGTAVSCTQSYQTPLPVCRSRRIGPGATGRAHPFTPLRRSLLRRRGDASRDPDIGGGP